MSRAINLADLTRDEVRSLAADSPLVIPLGATEQHGPHLPVGTDTILVSAIALRAAEQATAPDSIVLSPTLAFGSSQHHLPFGATLSLSGSTMTCALKELLLSAVTSGFRTVIVLNGHGGNADAVGAAIDTVGQSVDAVLAGASYWACSSASDLPNIKGRIPGHAGAFETSLMIVTAPGLVAHDRAHASPGPPPPSFPGARISTRSSWTAIDGFTDDPRLASADIGRAALGTLVNGVAKLFDEVWRQSRAARA